MAGHCSANEDGDAGGEEEPEEGEGEEDPGEGLQREFQRLKMEEGGRSREVRMNEYQRTS